jgi:drug/metabolite transporter (DMT)-like permease
VIERLSPLSATMSGMPALPALGVLSALAAAVTWGGGDFSGGIASRRHHPFQVVFLSSLTSLPPLLLLAFASGEGAPSPWSVVVATAAGAAGTLGLAAFYRGMLVGRTAVVSPVAAVLGAVVPLLIGLLKAGLPSPVTLAGFASGLLAIWMLAGGGPAAGARHPEELRMALLARIGFGGFLTLVAQVEPGQVFMPLVFTKLGSIAVAAFMVWRLRLGFPNLLSNRLALLSGILDTSGNVFYLLAAQWARLDVAAVLASLYPAGTVVLARLVIKEQMSRRSWLGLLVSLLAIALVSI